MEEPLRARNVRHAAGLASIVGGDLGEVEHRRTVLGQLLGECHRPEQQGRLDR